MSTPLEQKLARLLEREPERFGEHPPKKAETVDEIIAATIAVAPQVTMPDEITAFARMLPTYANDRRNAYWNIATGIIRHATHVSSWQNLIQLVDATVVRQETTATYYHYPEYRSYVPAFEPCLRRLASTMNKNDKAFLRLFVTAMVEGEGKPDQLLQAYFRGGAT